MATARKNQTNRARIAGEKHILYNGIEAARTTKSMSGTAHTKNMVLSTRQNIYRKATQQWEVWPIKTYERIYLVTGRAYTCSTPYGTLLPVIDFKDMKGNWRCTIPQPIEQGTELWKTLTIFREYIN
eukprot:10731420-Ditylum_brightwellii.AAC.1